MSFYYCLAEGWKEIHSRRRVNDSLQCAIALAIPRVFKYDTSVALESRVLREQAARALPASAILKATKHNKSASAEVSKSLTNFVREGWLARGTTAPGVER